MPGSHSFGKRRASWASHLLPQGAPWREGPSCSVLVSASVPGNPGPGQTETMGDPVPGSGPVEHFLWIKSGFFTRESKEPSEPVLTAPSPNPEPPQPARLARGAQRGSLVALSCGCARQPRGWAAGHRRGVKAVAFSCKNGFWTSSHSHR